MAVKTKAVKEIKYKSYKQLFDKYLLLNSSFNYGSNKTYVFRGEGNEHYKLMPSAFRPSAYSFMNLLLNKLGMTGITQEAIKKDVKLQINAEWIMMRQFFQNANMQGLKMPWISDKWMLRMRDDTLNDIYNIDEWIPEDLAEIFAMMQHYSFPTRMLDWTYNFSVAAYFASMSAAYRLKENKARKDENIVVWVMHLATANKYLTTDDGMPMIKVVIPPYANNPNLNAQKGVLTYIPINKKQINENNDPLKSMTFDNYINRCCIQTRTEDEVILERALVPIMDCYDMIWDLDALNVNTLSIYPGYGSIFRNCMEFIDFGPNG